MVEIRYKIKVKTAALDENFEQLIKELSDDCGVTCELEVSSSKQPETVNEQEKIFQYLKITLQGEKASVDEIFVWLLSKQPFNKLNKSKGERLNTLLADEEEILD